MTIEGSHTPMDHSRHEDEVDPVLSLVQLAACRPPYDTVRWDALADRIVADAQDELGRRRTVAGVPSVRNVRRGVRAWWEVTAGWARPALAAAVAMIAVAAALVISTPGALSGVAATDATTAGTLAASTDAIDAVMLETPSSVSEFESSPVTRDSLFSALVGQQ
jgi:hypothetical protein